MKFNRIFEGNELSFNYYNIVKEINNFDKIVLIFANDYELITVENIIKFYSRKFIKTYDNITNNSSNFNENDIEIIKNRLIPVIKLDNTQVSNYISDAKLSLLLNIDKIQTQNEEQFDKNNKINILKVIGPGEILNNNLYGYSFLENRLNNLKNETYSYFHYVSYLDEEKYNKFLFRFGGEVIETNNYYNSLEEKKTFTVIIEEFCYYFSKTEKYYELLSFSVIFYYFLIALSLLKKTGSLIINYYPCIFETTFQLYYIISTLFDSDFEILENKSNEFNEFNVFIKFNNFKDDKKIINKLRSIFDKYYEIDKTLGEKSILNKNLKNNILFDFDIDFETYKYKIIYKKLQKINLDIEKRRDYYLKKCKFIEKELIQNPYKKETYIENLITNALEFSAKYNLTINPYYNDYIKKFNNKTYNINIKKKMFPISKGINIDNLQVTYDSLYSITHPSDAEKISIMIKNKYPFINTITDMTANIGGNSINFCKHFKFVNSIEINKETSFVLENNLKEYKFTNFKVYNMSCLEFNEYSDLYFYDPPWGGIFYKMEEYINLYLGEKNIVEILKDNFCLKAPLNYNIKELIKKFPKIKIFKFKKYLIIINYISRKLNTKKNKLNHKKSKKK
jgi:hypothetical protein